MQRRSFLATLAAATAVTSGCGGLGTRDDKPATPPGSPGDQTPTDPRGNADRRDPPESPASVIDFEVQPHTVALSPTRFHTDDGVEIALWFDQTATEDHPARITGYVENRTEFENTFRVEWVPIVGRTHSRQPRGYGYEASLVAAPTADNGVADATPDVSLTEDGHWVVDATGSWMPDRYRMDPGERLALEYLLVGHPELEQRPVGTYEFRGRDEHIDVTIWPTASPGPAVDSRFAGRSVPTLKDEASVRWFHEADESTGAYVEPSVERLELDGLVEFEAVNHTHEVLSCGHWNLHKLVDGRWYHVGPFLHTDDCRTLLPGETKTWSLRAFNGEPVRCGSSCDSSGFTRGFLGGGVYAAVAGYGHPEQYSGSLVELDGDPVGFTLTDDAAVERDGATVTVTTELYGDGDHPPDASFELTGVDSADDRLIPEQIATGSDRVSSAERGLRNALAAMDSDVDRVVVRADDHVVDGATGHDRDVRRFELRGHAYRVERLSDE